MRPAVISFAVALFACPPGLAGAQDDPHARPATTAPVLQPPESIRDEHREIRAMLARASAEPGELGAAARDLRAVLDPHFRREEEIATPPLALLVPLSRGPATPQMRAVLPLTQALERELPRMLDEHRRIAVVRKRFEAAARRSGRDEYVRFAGQLAHHALQEEQILYPAAVLVGRHVAAVAPAR